MACPRFLLSDWMALPGEMDRGVHMFVLGDIHGQFRALDAALTWMENTATGHKELISLGDIIDYGPQSLLCRERLMAAAFDTIHMLPGNHEIMLAQALQSPQDHFPLWEMNGGQALLEELNLETACMRQAVTTIQDALGPHFIGDTLDGPSHILKGDCIFVHAGLSPHIPQKSFLQQKADAAVTMDCHWAWIREPFLSWKGGWNNEKTLTVFHGHTPELTHGFHGWKDLTTIYRPDHYRVNLDVSAQTMEQIAWAEIVEGFVRVGIVHMTNSDIF